VVQLFSLVQREISTAMLLMTVRESTTEELLRVQSGISSDLRKDIDRLDILTPDCDQCEETLGLLIAAAIPIHIRLDQIDLEPIFDQISMS
jgi:hypothetical protein